MSLSGALNTSNPLLRPPPPPATKLGQYRVLSPNAGVRVSPLCLGGMSIGDAWEKYDMGSMNKESSFKLLDAFYEAGGNFIDTASGYQEETSEKFIGEWMETRGNRDQMVIATKYTTFYKGHDASIKQKIQYVGNSTKVMKTSLEQSLAKLRTSYIDIFYVHWWDYSTSIEEVMNSLHNFVVAGKILYLGISDTPAWIVSKANQYARDHGKTPFSVYQGAWNVMFRDQERDIIPMARAEGMALAPYDVLAAGKIRTDAEEEERMRTGENGRAFFFKEWKRNEEQRKVCAALEKVAKEIGAKSIQAVAIAYLMQKAAYVFPIIGGRKVEHLHANIEALSLSLSKDHIKEIEGVKPFDLGFPGFLWGNGLEDEDLFMVRSAAETARWPVPQPIRPAQV